MSAGAAPQPRRRRRIWVKLLLVNAIVGAVPLVGIAFAQRHERQLLHALERDLIHQGQVVRAVLATAPRGDEPGAPALEATLATAARDTRTRIRILDGEARVIADSHRRGPPEGAELPAPRLLGYDAPRRAAEAPREVPLGERREIRAALAGRYGAATRLWGDQERVYLFVALPVRRAAPGVGARPGAARAAAAERAPPSDPAAARVVYVTRSTQDVKRQLFELRAWLVRLLAGTLATTALLTVVLATAIARPLARLTRHAQRIAAREPAPAAGERGLAELRARPDELGELARAVAAMTAELERRAEDARTLAADLSHELKNPLAGIRGAAELLRDGAADDAAARERFLAMIEADAARLDRVATRLLEVARAEDDRATPGPIDLVALARECAARPWPAPVEVVARGDGARVVRGRSAPLAAAIENLIANAAQHAAPGTGVTVAVAEAPGADAAPAPPSAAAPSGASGAARSIASGARRGGHRAARITVENRGPALSAAARDRVWDRFYSTRTAAGGSGLGLAIVRAAALAHGGRVGVDCGGGVTAFWIELPAADAPPAGS